MPGPATFWDHALVVVVFVVVFPVLGWWSYRRFLERAAIEGEPALIREYRQTIFLWLGGLGLATLMVWLGQGRPLAALFTTEPSLLDATLAHGIAAGVAIGILARPVLVLVSRKAAAQMAGALKPLAPFLPKSLRALAWGIAVSLAAGVVEEVAYRGFLVPYVSSMASLWASIVVSALLFGAAHLYQGTTGVMSTAALGAILAVVYVGTGSLWLPMLLHALIDISSMVTAYLVFGPRNLAGS